MRMLYLIIIIFDIYMRTYILCIDISYHVAAMCMTYVTANLILQQNLNIHKIIMQMWWHIKILINCLYNLHNYYYICS